ncbi:MAG TPA: Nif3-like dinuclear metal center hexameric protein, partial [Phycisphaerae bacterium]|nr:Nif3-like dinuclear metal center hexameric protein [Phycisphaerae bacterium]
TLEQAAAKIKSRMKIRTLRVVGDPQMRMTHIALLPGAAGAERQIRLLERDDVEVLVAGESREWETVEYVRDAVTAGEHKALILMGHVPSEEAGMDECARWLKGIVPEVPVEYVPAGEPFWTPRP